MKRYFSLMITILAFMEIMAATPAVSAVLKARAMTHVMTKPATPVVSVKAISKMTLRNGEEIVKGDILTGEMFNVKGPEKWCKNASFSYRITAYTDVKGETHQLSGDDILTYRQKMKADFENSEITAGNADGWMFRISPRDIHRIGESSSVVDYGERYYNENAPWRAGKEIDIEINELIYFNY